MGITKMVLIAFALNCGIVISGANAVIADSTGTFNNAQKEANKTAENKAVGYLKNFPIYTTNLQTKLEWWQVQKEKAISFGVEAGLEKARDENSSVSVNELKNAATNAVEKCLTDQCPANGGKSPL